MKKGKHGKKKFEFSKLVAGLIIFYGMATGIAYYVLMWKAMSSDNINAIVPDASLAVQCCVSILGGFVGYIVYQAKLKCSRNQCHVDENGIPFGVEENELNIEDTPLDMQEMQDN